VPAPAQVIRDVWRGTVSVNDFQLIVTRFEDSDDFDG
jgi:hypothetical protein